VMFRGRIVEIGRTEDLFALGLSADTGAVVSCLKNSEMKRKGPGYSLGSQGMSLLLDLVRRSLDLGEPEKAASLMDSLSPECLGENTLTAGDLFLQYGFPELAGGYLLMHLEFNPQSAQANFSLAKAKEELGQYPEAISLYRRALDLDPREPRHYIRLIRLYEKMRRELIKEALVVHPESQMLKNLLEGGPDR